MADSTSKRVAARSKRHRSIRLKVSGTPERPRLCVHRSHRYIYAQIIDDSAGRSLASISSLSPEAKKGGAVGNNKASAKIIGEMLAEKAIAQGIESVVFDRGGFLYHGKVKALAEGAREKGLKF
jgi:large subunit ribosomal protein L18